MGSISSIRREGLYLAGQGQLYLDVLGDLKSSYLAHRPLVRLDVEDPPVDPELPVVERVRPLARRSLPRGYLQSLGRERLGTLAFDACLLSNLSDLLGKPVQLLNIGAGQLDSGKLWHYP